MMEILLGVILTSLLMGTLILGLCITVSLGVVGRLIVSVAILGIGMLLASACGLLFVLKQIPPDSRTITLSITGSLYFILIYYWMKTEVLRDIIETLARMFKHGKY